MNAKINPHPSWAGEKNINWNGGISEYPNHHQFKKNRIISLLEHGNRCSLCGEPAKVVHHMDFSKTNHDTLNLLPLCLSCHSNLHSGRRGATKYTRKYGMNVAQMSEKCGVTTSTILAFIHGRKRKYKEETILKLKQIPGLEFNGGV